jgi:hypothetical protein
MPWHNRDEKVGRLMLRVTVILRHHPSPSDVLKFPQTRAFSLGLVVHSGHFSFLPAQRIGRLKKQTH